MGQGALGAVRVVFETIWAGKDDCFHMMEQGLQSAFAGMLVGTEHRGLRPTHPLMTQHRPTPSPHASNTIFGNESRSAHRESFSLIGCLHKLEEGIREHVRVEGGGVAVERVMRECEETWRQ